MYEAADAPWWDVLKVPGAFVLFPPTFPGKQKQRFGQRSQPRPSAPQLAGRCSRRHEELHGALKDVPGGIN